ncbi:ComEC/Rec2 family competence protein [Halorientalis persicus]|nr:MBL fold metallo-hydrolase [Halorientalis persicus]
MTRDTVPAVRPNGETISDPENTLYSSFAARNHMFLPRPGLPLIPWPTYWYLSVNNLNVQVQGEYARFEVTATSGSPMSSGATSYIRQSQPVSLEINGLQRKVGEVEPIDFRNVTPIVLMTPGGTVQPTGSLGPGDIAGSRPKHSLKECTKTWKYTGADFDPQTDVTASECANIQQADAGGLSAFQAFVPDGHQGTVETVSEYVDDDDDDYGDLCHLSGSAGLALRGGVGTPTATVADDDDDAAGCPDSELSVNFINVGKGTAIFVNGTDGQSMLIDAGSRKHPDKYGQHPSDRVEEVIHDTLDDVGDEPYEVEYLVVTHNHGDHLNFVDKIDGVEFGTVYHQGELQGDGLPNEPDSYDHIETLQEDDGDEIDLGTDSMEVTVHHPVDGLWTQKSGHPCGGGTSSGKLKDCNSIVMSLEWGGTKFAFGSDIRANTKRYLWDGTGPFRGADVVQVAHHGSETSLLDEPIYCRTPGLESAVISNVKEDRKGPDAPVLQALDDAGISTYWTGVHGNVEYVVKDGGDSLWLTPESEDGDARQTAHSADAGSLVGMADGPTHGGALCSGT